MPSVVCPLCGSPWIAADPVTGPDARCLRCAKPIKLVSRDFETVPAEWSRETARTTSDRSLGALHVAVPDVEAQYLDEEARRWVSESKTWLRVVVVAAVVVVATAVWGAVKLRNIELGPAIVASVTVAWLALAALLIYWYRRSRAGDYEASRAAVERRVKADKEQVEVTSTPKYLIGTGFAVAMFASAMGRGLKFSGADKSPAIILVTLVMLPATIAVLVGCVWLLKYRFKYLRVADVLRLYSMLTFMAAVVAAFNFASMR